MYGKLFASTFTGSLCGSGPTVFAVWAYVIAHAVDSSVELNPRLLCGILGTDAQSVADAIELLGRPDPESRNTDHDGRRLIRDGQYQYRVVSHAIYRAMKSDDERRAYNREKQRESRERRSIGQTLSTRDVNDSQDNTDTNTGTDPKAVRTQDRSTYRTSDRNLLSTTTTTESAAAEDRRADDRRAAERRATNGPGAFEPGSLPRDHMTHVVCSHTNRDLCVGYKLFDALSEIYNSNDKDETKSAIEKWLREFEVPFARGGGKSPGGFAWMVKEFRSWVTSQGRVPEVSKPAKKPERTAAEIASSVRALMASKAAAKAARK